MTVRTGKRGKKRMALGIAFWLACAGTIPVYGGQWVQPLEGQWAYEEDGVFLAGWREIDGAWYCFGADGLMQTGWVRAGEKQLWHYLDQETGAWQPRPALNEEAAQKERISTLSANIKNLMEKMGWSAEQSMDVLSVSDSDRRALWQLLK